MNFKKVLLTVSLIFGTSTLITVVPVGQETVNAKTKNISHTMAVKIKKGTFPGLNRRIGDSWNSIYTFNRNVDWSTDGLLNRAMLLDAPDGTVTYYMYGQMKDNITAVSKTYFYDIKEKSLCKYFGKPYKGLYKNGEKLTNTHVYKAGKRYLYFSRNYYGGSTYMIIGNKQSIFYFNDLKKIYRPE